MTTSSVIEIDKGIPVNHSRNNKSLFFMSAINQSIMSHVSERKLIYVPTHHILTFLKLFIKVLTTDSR